MLSKLKTLLASDTGVNKRATLIVRGGRAIYSTFAVTLAGTWYFSWRNARVAPGEPAFPFPGVDRLRARFAVDRPEGDVDPGYSPGGEGGGITGGLGKSLGMIVGGGVNPGGGWAGSEGVVKSLTAGYKELGLQVTSEKRDDPGSDHGRTSTTAYALDISNGTQPTKEMDRLARMVTSRLGIHYTGGELVETVTKNGYRIQVLYRTNVGGNHFNHVHTGARKV